MASESTTCHFSSGTLPYNLSTLTCREKFEDIRTMIGCSKARRMRDEVEKYQHEGGREVW